MVGWVPWSMAPPPPPPPLQGCDALQNHIPALPRPASKEGDLSRILKETVSILAGKYETPIATTTVNKCYSHYLEGLGWVQNTSIGSGNRLPLLQINVIFIVFGVIRNYLGIGHPQACIGFLCVFKWICLWWSWQLNCSTSSALDFDRWAIYRCCPDIDFIDLQESMELILNIFIPMFSRAQEHPRVSSHWSLRDPACRHTPLVSWQWSKAKVTLYNILMYSAIHREGKIKG